MSSVFNADDNDIPFFCSRISLVSATAELAFSGAHSESHVPGRHLNALLNAEDAAGIPVDEAVIAKHARAAFFSYSGPVPLPLNRERLGGPLVNFSPHNVREGLHALYALAEYRDDARARQVAEQSIEFIRRHWTPDDGWDCRTLEGRCGLQYHRPQTLIVGLARSIGPLVKYHRATGYGAALDLAVALKDKAVSEFFRADGEYDSERFGTHTHSTTCVMSSLAQLADLTCDAQLMDRVKTFYDNGLREIRDELGWSPENAGQGMRDLRGEANNTGDILETALILGHSGHAEYYHDAERILRGHLLPCQLRDTSFIREEDNPRSSDGYRNVAERHLGAFGFPTPYGHISVKSLQDGRVSFNMDVVGGVVGSLCEAYREVVRVDESGARLNLLFDHENDTLRVESPYTHGALRVHMKKTVPLSVRVPPWADPAALSVEGQGSGFRWADGYVSFPAVPAGSTLVIRFPLAEQTITLSGHTRPIRVKLTGDAVTAMDNFGTDLTFFPTR